jgi:acyl-CoA thioesterase YciA
MKDISVHPDGELVIKTVAMPGDTNSNGDIFGGWILSQMDLGGGIIAKTYSPSGRAVTIAIDGMAFINPVQVGESVSCYAKILKFGRSSLQIKIETWVYNYSTHVHKIVTRGHFTYVAINDSGVPIRMNNPNI